jgi:adenylyltransferase/sulfurtransferase
MSWPTGSDCPLQTLTAGVLSKSACWPNLLASSSSDPGDRLVTVLDEESRRRYARQIVLPEIGEAGQARLAASRVLIVGLGGLGSPASLYLAAAGVGRMTLVDFDRVDATNLHRQLLYGDRDVGRPKLEAAAERLGDQNPALQIDLVEGPLDTDNATAIVKGHDLVLDGTDNFPARYAVNDACVATQTPNVHGAVQRFEGQVMVLAAEGAPCYRCLFPEPPPPGSVPSCAEAGVLGVLPGIVGALQATEALKLLLGIGTPVAGRMVRFDALGGRFTEIGLARDEGCSVCGATPTPPGVEPVESDPALDELHFTISLEELARRREKGAAPLVLDVRLPEELRMASFPGEVVHIPLHELPGRIPELDSGSEYAVICHHGVRSMQAVHFLRANGIPGARDVAGGIDGWSATIDPSVPRY